MFQSGEFSKISRVSKRLLHYYDEIGLFKPSYTDPMTGYRYYSADQLRDLNKILVLKDLGLSLSQIANLVKDNISNDEVSGMLKMKKSEIIETIQNDVRRLRRIEARLQQNTADDTNSTDVVIKSIPEQSCLSARAVYTSNEMAMQAAIDILYQCTRYLKPSQLDKFTGVMYSDAFNMENIDLRLGYMLSKPYNQAIKISETCSLTSCELPAIKETATSIQTTEPDLMFLTLGRIAKWIETSGYRIAGPFREVLLEAPPIKTPEDAMAALQQSMIEVQIPVEKVHTPPQLVLDTH